MLSHHKQDITIVQVLFVMKYGCASEEENSLMSQTMVACGDG